MSRGDHLVVRRSRWYAHHAIDLGDGTVVHYAGDRRSGELRVVAREPWEAFALGGDVRVRTHHRSSAPDKVVRRAMEALGERRYKLVRNNCEHFATWCSTDRAHSWQVRRYTSWSLYGVGFSVSAALQGSTLLFIGLVGLGVTRLRTKRHRPQDIAYARAIGPSAGHAALAPVAATI